MPNIRRGFPPGVVPAANRRFAAPAKAGVIASSNGNESRMPAPRRNRRRERAGRVETDGALTLDKRVFMVSAYAYLIPIFRKSRARLNSFGSMSGFG
jgi:hypothetical protein